MDFVYQVWLRIVTDIAIRFATLGWWERDGGAVGLDTSYRLSVDRKACLRSMRRIESAKKYLLAATLLHTNAS